MINPENLTWEPLMKVHLSNERDCSATSVIYEFELNYDAVTNKTNILEATNFGERFISGSCLGLEYESETWMWEQPSCYHGVMNIKVKANSLEERKDLSPW